MDTGQKLTDEELKKLERRITKEYKTAVKEMEQKLKDYLEETEAGRQVQLQLYRAGKISKDDYENWVYRHTMVGKRWEAMRDTLAADMHKTNEIAKAMSEGQAADVFALNGNYATYQLEHDGKIDTGFTLYNHDTAQYLLEDQRQLMPVPSDKKAREIAANKDMKWNMKKIQSAVLQGVMQGESPYAVAERLEQVGQMNHNSAVRYARTMTTSAQNAGRYEAYRRADKLGVNLSIEWQATLDSRTRHDHRLMHGQRRKVDEPFILPDGQKILFPADCTHNSYELQGEIWNCRCTLLSWVKGFEGDTVKNRPKMDGMSFEEWQNEKAPKETQQKPKINPFTPADTKDEAIQYAKRFSKNVNYDGISLQNINAINEQLTHLTEKYPTKQLDDIFNKSRGIMSANYHHLNINGKKLGKTLSEEEERFNMTQAWNRAQVDYLKSKWTGKKIPFDVQRQIDKLEKNLRFTRYGVHSSYDDHVKCIVTHEYGHIIADQYFGMSNKEMANPNYSTNWALREMNEQWKSVYKKAYETGDIYKLSEYGASNHVEFFAESFLAREMGEKLPDYVESLMSEVLKNGIM